MKYFVFFTYLLVIVAGGVFIVAGHGGPNLKLVAARDLTANHLLQPGDLQLLTDGRQYVTRLVESGEVVDPGAIKPLPDLSASAGAVPVAVSVAREQVTRRVVDAGKSLIICPPNVRVVVRAVFCGEADTPCIAVVDVAAADAEAVKTTDADLILQAKSSCE